MQQNPLKTQKNKPETFRFVSYAFDVETSTASLNYAFDEEYYFTETVQFRNAEKVLTPEQAAAVENIMFFLHLACGISYYKAFVPGRIQIETGVLNREQAAFFDEFYKNFCRRERVVPRPVMVERDVIVVFISF